MSENLSGNTIIQTAAEAIAEQKALEEAALRESFYQNRPHDSINQRPLEIFDESKHPLYSETESGPIGHQEMPEPDLLTDLLVNAQPFLFPAFLAVSGFVVRAIVTKKKTKFFEFLLDCLAAMIIGALVGIAIDDMDLSKNIKYAIIAIAGMVGPDLAGGVIILGQSFRDSPTEFVLKHYHAFRGIKGEHEKPEEGKDKMTYEDWNKANKEFIDKTFG